MKHIATLLRIRPTLTALYLDGNQIGDAGVEQLAKALSHPLVNLQKLYVHENKQITDRSVNYLVRMLNQNHSLNTLWLLECSFSINGRQELIEAAQLKNKLYLNIERFT
jgi:Ran GTPase-activating protein (RanGAP) involved in mRNA processing and transport